MNEARDDRADERALVLAARAGGEREREQLTEAFLRRIALLAREYDGVRAVTREELMQAGVLGLLKALERYDSARPNHFWTYARVVVLSDRALRQLARINAARHEHVQCRGREPSVGGLAAMTGLPVTQVTMLIGAAQPPQPLDERGDAEQRAWGRPIAESLRDPAGEDGFEHATLRVAAGALPAVLATLTARELVIVRGRYGMDGKQRSLSYLAGKLSVSTERVRQIELDAMRKLRESCDTTGDHADDLGAAA